MAAPRTTYRSVPITWPPEVRVTFGNMARWEKGGPWPAPLKLSVEWEVVGGKAVPVAIELRSPHGEPITAEAWRSVRVADVIERTRGELRGIRKVQRAIAQLDNRPDDAEQAEAEAEQFTRPRKRGRPPEWPAQHYRDVASVYLAAVAASDPKPVRAVAAEWQLDDPNDYRPKAWVREARRRGLIPPTERKRNG